MNIVLVDFNNILYRAVFAHEGLSHRGIFTGGLFGFIDMLSSTVNRYKGDRVIVCQDSKPYYRSEFYPKYKSDRSLTNQFDDDRLKQLSISRKQILSFIRTFGIPFVEAAGHEADDIIGEYCCTTRPPLHHRMFIMSNDSDLYQLLNWRIFLVKTGGLYGIVDFRKEYPLITPSQWPRCVALKGSHNGVEGIHGVGDKTAYKAVVEKMTDLDIAKKWGMRRRQLSLSTKLATFPFPLVDRPRIKNPRKLKYNAQNLEEECDRYGIRFKDEFHAAFTRLSN